MNRLYGQLSFDITVSEMDVNQCDDASVTSSLPDSGGRAAEDGERPIVTYFMGTHKCHNETSTVPYRFAYHHLNKWLCSNIDIMLQYRIPL